MEYLEKFEQTLVDIVAPLMALMAPLITAYLTARAAIVHLGLPLPFGIVAGAVVEFLGFSSTGTAMMLYSYNRTKRKVDPVAPLWIALALVAVYMVVVTGLTYLVDTVPELARFAPLVFPFIGILAATLVALRVDHRQRVATIEADRAERKAARSGKRSGDRSVTGQMTGQGTTYDRSTETSLAKANATRRLNKEDAMAALVEYYRLNPGASYSDAGRAVDRSKAWVVGAVSDLEGKGKIKRNGSGVEVV